jgi:hypothetical protein
MFTLLASKKMGSSGVRGRDLSALQRYQFCNSGWTVPLFKFTAMSNFVSQTIKMLFYRKNVRCLACSYFNKIKVAWLLQYFQSIKLVS